MADDNNVTKAPTLNEVYGVLWEQVEALRTGKTTPANANAVSNAIGKIWTGLKVEIEYSRMTGQTPRIPLLIAPTDDKPA